MQGRQIRVLVVDDDEDDFLMLRDLLSEVRGTKFALEWASSYDLGREKIAQGAHDVCFLDYRLGARTGLDLLKEMIAAGVKTPMILLTGYGEQEVDLEAMRVGAADYLVKDQVSSNLIERSIRYSLYRAQNIEALRQREIQILLQDRLASVGLLASSLAHEIGTPLGVIRGRAEFLSIQTKSDPTITKNVDVIIAEIDRVSRLIRSLLNLARGDSSKAAGKIELNRVVSDVLDLMAHELRKHSIRLENRLTDGTTVAVRADAAPLHQVLLNLLVNSVHAIDSAVAAGRPDGHFIRLFVEESGSFWSLKIQDSGCGISEENMKNLFKPFFTTKDIGVGTGLGLATSYRIVEAWGGKILVESQFGTGTVFTNQLPRP
ncbi:MAG: sensor histidine kinase [Bdellovibrionota bacterium]